MTIPRSARPVPASPDVQLEPWLRAVRYLQAAGLAPVVPVDVSWRLLDEHDMRIAAPVELPWTRAA